MSTELEAVNTILRSAGDAVTTTLSTTDEDVVSANGYLDDARKEFLLKGWPWNRSCVTFTGGGISGKRILINSTTYLSVITPVTEKWTVRYDSVEDDYFLWDLEDETFEILTTAAEEYELEVLVDLTWLELHASAQTYVTYTAAFHYVSHNVGDRSVIQTLASQRQIAWGDVRHEQIRQGRPSIFGPRTTRLFNTSSRWRR